MRIDASEFNFLKDDVEGILRLVTRLLERSYSISTEINIYDFQRIGTSSGNAAEEVARHNKQLIGDYFCEQLVERYIKEHDLGSTEARDLRHLTMNAAPNSSIKLLSFNIEKTTEPDVFKVRMPYFYRDKPSKLPEMIKAAKSKSQFVTEDQRFRFLLTTRAVLEEVYRSLKTKIDSQTPMLQIATAATIAPAEAGPTYSALSIFSRPNPQAKPPESNLDKALNAFKDYRGEAHWEDVISFSALLESKREEYEGQDHVTRTMLDKIFKDILEEMLQDSKGDEAFVGCITHALKELGCDMEQKAKDSGIEAPGEVEALTAKVIAHNPASIATAPSQQKVVASTANKTGPQRRLGRLPIPQSSVTSDIEGDDDSDSDSYKVPLIRS